MSRIAKYPVNVPDKVQVTVDKSKVVVKGPLGTLEQAITHEVVVKLEDGKVTFAAANESKAANAMSGTLRATVANMVHGVKDGFSKKLTLVGVG
jgi:large subunit ribosomal protein L6